MKFWRNSSLFLYKAIGNDSNVFFLCPVHGGADDDYRVPERNLGTGKVTKKTQEP